MASSIDLLAKINDEFLTCQICFETYTRPKSLNCQHTFCQKCLEEYTPPTSVEVICPTCRCEQPLTQEGINGLKDNFFISSMADMLKTVKEIRSEDKDGASLMCDTCDDDKRKVATARCLDCTDFLCSECSTWHKRTKLTKNHKIVSLTEFESGMHNEELKSRAKIYCMVNIQNKLSRMHGFFDLEKNNSTYYCACVHSVGIRKIFAKIISVVVVLFLIVSVVLDGRAYERGYKRYIAPGPGRYCAA